MLQLKIDLITILCSKSFFSGHNCPPISVTLGRLCFLRLKIIYTDFILCIVIPDTALFLLFFESVQMCLKEMRC